MVDLTYCEGSVSILEKDKANIPPNKEATVFFQTVSIYGGLTSTPITRSSSKLFHVDCNVIVSVCKIKGICNTSDNTRVEHQERGKSGK